MPKIAIAPKKEREVDIQDAIRLALGQEPDLFLTRNSVAGVETWDPKTGRSRFHKAGLGVGWPDLVGIFTRADGAGIFFGLECKRPGERPTPEQEAVLTLIRRRKGFAAVVCSVDEARNALERARKGLHE